MDKWKIEHTCRTCGYRSCRDIIIKNGWSLDANIEVTNGYAWSHICPRWQFDEARFAQESEVDND